MTISKNKKILLVMGSGASPVADSSIFVDYIFGALKNNGHDVHLFQFNKFLDQATPSQLKDPKGSLEEEIFNQYNHYGPFDYFLSFLSDQQVTPEIYKLIGKNTFTINWSCNMHQFDDLHKDIAPHVNLNTYIQLKHKALYDSVGANSYWSPMAASPEASLPTQVEKDIDLSFIGTAYGNRPHYIWRLILAGFKPNVYGFGWDKKTFLQNILRLHIAPIIYPFLEESIAINGFDRVLRELYIQRIFNGGFSRGIPTDSEYLSLLSRSKISLNFPENRENNNFSSPYVNFCCNLRDFEIPMANSMLFTQFNYELEHFYEDGKEVVSFYNDEDMIDKLQYYQKNPSISEAIANAGYKRAVLEHTWNNRLNQLISYADSIS
jgi:spore maturation protein CgeB